MWLVGLGTQPRSPVLLVLVVGSLEPHDLGIAFERQHVGRDPVEEPAVMRDHDGAAREVDEGVLEGAQRVDRGARYGTGNATAHRKRARRRSRNQVTP